MHSKRQYTIALFKAQMYYFMQEVSTMQPLTFGERLVLIRKRHKMTQRQLAERIGCQQSDIYRLESGLVNDPHMSRLVALAQVLQVSTDWLSGLRDTTDEVDTMPPTPLKAKRVTRAAPSPTPSRKAAIPARATARSPRPRTAAPVS